jgi:outer membrane protein TolC
VAARDTARLADVSYRSAVASDLEVRDNERQPFDAEPGVVGTRRDEFVAVVHVYKAPGGGWQEP